MAAKKKTTPTTPRGGKPKAADPIRKGAAKAVAKGPKAVKKHNESATRVAAERERVAAEKKEKFATTVTEGDKAPAAGGKKKRYMPKAQQAPKKVLSKTGLRKVRRKSADKKKKDSPGIPKSTFKPLSPAEKAKQDRRNIRRDALQAAKSLPEKIQRELDGHKNDLASLTERPTDPLIPVENPTHAEHQAHLEALINKNNKKIEDIQSEPLDGSEREDIQRMKKNASTRPLVEQNTRLYRVLKNHKAKDPKKWDADVARKIESKQSMIEDAQERLAKAQATPVKVTAREQREKITAGKAREKILSFASKGMKDHKGKVVAVHEFLKYSSPEHMLTSLRKGETADEFIKRQTKAIDTRMTQLKAGMTTTARRKKPARTGTATRGSETTTKKRLTPDEVEKLRAKVGERATAEKTDMRSGTPKPGDVLSGQISEGLEKIRKSGQKPY